MASRSSTTTWLSCRASIVIEALVLCIGLAVNRVEPPLELLILCFEPLLESGILCSESVSESRLKPTAEVGYLLADAGELSFTHTVG